MEKVIAVIVKILQSKISLSEFGWTKEYQGGSRGRAEAMIFFFWFYLMQRKEKQIKFFLITMVKIYFKKSRRYITTWVTTDIKLYSLIKFVF